jgi:DNA adenine methylase
MKKPFPWYGGKEVLAPYLVTLLPPHEVYVEVFGGSGALLFAKQPSKLEIYNDIDSGLVNFFRVMRDREQSDELQRLLQLTPYAREEYHECRRTWQDTSDSIEKARRWYVGTVQSMNSSMRSGGWSSTKAPGSNPASKWQSHIAHLPEITGRLNYVQIDHRDFATVMAAYDSPDTIFYLDPPYTPDSRMKQNCYDHEMTTEDHERMLGQIKRLRGMVVLSGYESLLYHEALTGWDYIRKSFPCSSAGRTRGTGLQGDGVILASQMRTECIWRNPAAAARSTSLWNEVPA